MSALDSLSADLLTRMATPPDIRTRVLEQSALALSPAQSLQRVDAAARNLSSIATALLAALAAGAALLTDVLRESPALVVIAAVCGAATFALAIITTIGSAPSVDVEDLDAVARAYDQILPGRACRLRLASFLFCVSVASAAAAFVDTALSSDSALAVSASYERTADRELTVAEDAGRPGNNALVVAYVTDIRGRVLLDAVQAADGNGRLKALFELSPPERPKRLVITVQLRRRGEKPESVTRRLTLLQSR